MIWERVPFAHREPHTTRRGTGSHGLLRILRAVAAASAGARAPPAGIRREPVGLRDGALHAAVVLRRQQHALRTHRRRASYYASMTCVYVQLERRGTPARRWYRGHGSASVRRIPTPPSPPCHQLDIWHLRTSSRASRLRSRRTTQSTRAIEMLKRAAGPAPMQ
eukprot:COSAG01_NODE_1635_length_9663_cov_75.743831_14_plen_164_part_00